MNFEFARRIFSEYSNKFHKKPSIGGRVVSCWPNDGGTDRQLDMVKLIVACWNFENAPKSHINSIMLPIVWNNTTTNTITDLNTQQGAMKMLRKHIQWKRTNKMRNKSVQKLFVHELKLFPVIYWLYLCTPVYMINRYATCHAVYNPRNKIGCFDIAVI